MTILWANNASTTVSGSITAASTTVSLAAGTGVRFPNPTGGNYYKATFYDQATKTQYEIVHVTAMSGDIATIVRAQEGTTALAWSAGDIFANLITAGTLAAFVQAGVGPANTSIVYVGTDTGTQNHIVAVTNPVPSSLAIGMLFNIKVLNTNSGPTDVQLNGGVAIALTRSNGAALTGGDVTASEEVTFVYNGVNFNTMLPDIKHPPPVTTFYVRTDGNDNNSGWANDAADAFATIYGAVNQISARYSAQNVITVRVADGTYFGGVGFNSTYIAQWSLVGNISNPANCVIDATSTSPPAGSAPGSAIALQAPCNVTVQGFTTKSLYYNLLVQNGGYLSAATIMLTGYTYVSSGGYGIVGVSGGTCYLGGNIWYTSGGRHVDAIFTVGGGGLIRMGLYDPTFGIGVTTFNFTEGSPGVSNTFVAATSGSVGLDFRGGALVWTGGTPNGAKYFCYLGGGVNTVGNLNLIPGASGGTVQSPGWAA